MKQLLQEQIEEAEQAVALHERNLRFLEDPSARHYDFLPNGHQVNSTDKARRRHELSYPTAMRHLDEKLKQSAECCEHW